MKKAELEKVIVRSFPIYELLQIRIEGHHYPRRQIRQQRLGFFDTKEHAQEAMLSTIEFQKRVCLKRGKNYYDDCFGFFLLEQFVHNRESSFYRNERPQKCFSFNADGELNDFVALDEMGWYRGRKIEDIRFNNVKEYYFSRNLRKLLLFYKKKNYICTENLNMYSK